MQSSSAQKPSLPKIPIPPSVGIVENSLAQKVSVARLKKNVIGHRQRSAELQRADHKSTCQL